LTQLYFGLLTRLEVLEDARIVRPKEVQNAWMKHQGDAVEQICAVADSVVSIDERLKTLEDAELDRDVQYVLEMQRIKINSLEDQLATLMDRLRKSAVLTQNLWLAPAADWFCHSKSAGADSTSRGQREAGGPIFPAALGEPSATEDAAESTSRVQREAGAPVFSCRL
jgi:hypothetical protein